MISLGLFYSPWYQKLFNSCNLNTCSDSQLYQNTSSILNSLKTNFRMLAVSNDVTECLRVDLLGKYKNMIANSGYYVFGAYITTVIWSEHYLKWTIEKENIDKQNLTDQEKKVLFDTVKKNLNKQFVDSLFFQSVASFLIPLSVVVSTRTCYNKLITLNPISKYITLANNSKNASLYKFGFGVAPVFLSLAIVFQIIHPADHMIENFQKTNNYIQNRDNVLNIYNDIKQKLISFMS